MAPRRISGESGLARLLRLNPWAEPFLPALATGQAAPALAARTASGAGFRMLRAAAAAERLAQGRAAWRRWSDGMLTLKASAGRLSGAWEALAAVEISDRRFSDPLDAAGLAFPGALRLSGVEILGECWLSTARFHGAVSVSDARFSGEVALDRAVFAGPALFERVVFERRVEATALRGAGFFSFRRGRFARDCWFRDSVFAAGVDFTETAFESDAGFLRATFEGDADFSGARFGGPAGFEGARFAAAARFDAVVADGRVWSRGASFARPADRVALERLAAGRGATGRPAVKGDLSAKASAENRRKRGA